MNDHNIYPFEPATLQRQKRSLRRKLSEQQDLVEKKIAVFGGSTTAEVKDMMELFLLQEGIRPLFYESGYNRYFEDAMFPGAALLKFAPDFVYIHTTSVNITRYPAPGDREEDVSRLLDEETLKLEGMWQGITAAHSCPVIQNNFELPRYRLFGNLDSAHSQGRTSFVASLNRILGDKVRQHANVYLNDINYLSAWMGLERWYDNRLWYSSKYAMSMAAIPVLAHSVVSVIKALLGKSKKCLVLDLDNTLWGGVIGDEGLGGIRIGRETAEAEAYTEFQTYVSLLKQRGVVLAVCSKNAEPNAREGFGHPDTVLKIDDFSRFCANWEPKHDNVRSIASELSLGLDSLVFADDNPAERDLVRSSLPQVSVPEIGDSVTSYIDVLDKSGLFEAVSVTSDDLLRNSFYAGNALRLDMGKRFCDQGEYLKSLEMTADIQPFATEYLERIAQLINKTNQFNLTTRRYTRTEIDRIAADDNCITLFGRLKDKFGDNGLVSVIIGTIQDQDLVIDLWVMSCRVFQRTLEFSMFDALVASARARGIQRIVGRYFATAKNGLVSGLFEDMGFTRQSANQRQSEWCLDLASGYTSKGTAIATT